MPFKIVKLRRCLTSNVQHRLLFAHEEQLQHLKIQDILMSVFGIKQHLPGSRIKIKYLFYIVSLSEMLLQRWGRHEPRSTWMNGSK